MLRTLAIVLSLSLLPACLFDYVEGSVGASRSEGEVLRGSNGTTPIAATKGNSVFAWITGGVFLDKAVRAGYLEREAREQRVDDALAQRDVREVVRDELEDVLEGALDRRTPAEPAPVYGPEPMPDWGSAILAELAERKRVDEERKAELEVLRNREPESSWGELIASGITGAIVLLAGMKGGPPAAAAAKVGRDYVMARVRRRGAPPDGPEEPA